MKRLLLIGLSILLLFSFCACGDSSNDVSSINSTVAPTVPLLCLSACAEATLESVKAICFQSNGVESLK
jgi:hypothetical protein